MQQFALRLGQPIPDIEIDDRRGRPVIVIGHRAVFRHLIGLQRQDVDDRQVGAVDDARLRRRDHLAPGHRHRDPTQSVDRVGEHLGLLHPHLEAAQVFRLADRPLAVPEMAEAVVVEEQHLELVFLLELLVEPATNLAVEQLVGLIVAGDQIGHEKDAHLGEHRRRGAARIAHRDIAGFDRVDDLELLGQQRAAVELHDQFALRALGHLFRHLDEGDGR